MEISGEVTSIIYRNETNGYTVAEIDYKKVPLTIVGFLPFVNKGDSLKLVGNFVTHQDYGEQFKVTTFEKQMPQTLDAIERYIGNGIIKGIGKATAKKIVKKFGEDTINILKSSPEKLSLIKGITYEKAESICEDFNEKWNLWEIVGFLQNFGIGVESAQTIYKKLGENTIDEIKKNPYILEEIGVKVDFSQIDKMALSIGFERNSLKRIGSGIIHALKLASYNGHSCVLQSNLINFVTGLLGVSQEDVQNGIKDLASKEKINIENRENVITQEGKTEIQIQTWIFLNIFYKAELNIARKIKSLQEANNIKKIKNIDNIIKEVSDITPSDKQKQALKMCNDNNVVIITGGPGTGKTTIIKTIINMYKRIGKKTVLCAPTGRAAKRMTEATGEEAKTLHRLLEIGKINDDNPNPDLNVSPIDADIVIIDEMSMVDLFLMSYLLNGLFKGTKLVMVGDVDQLESVGPGCVLKDLIESNVVPSIALNKIFRQAAKSQIIVNAHKVNQGESFIGEEDIEDDTLDDFIYLPETNYERTTEIITNAYNTNTQIITPTKRGELGTKELNKLIQEKFNPSADYKKEKKFGDAIFRVNDKVMQTQNNYDIEWTKLNLDTGKTEHSTGIFNGEMGTIIDIDEYEDLIVIKFEDGKIARYKFTELDQIVHSYAITVHKSQGSEFDYVIMPIINVPRMLLTRNVLYTGMTRARKKLMLISNETTIEYMIGNVNSKKRNSGLKFKLQEIFKD